MTQQEHWTDMWRRYMGFMRRNGRRPSRNRKREAALANWLKYNRKRRNKEELPPDRCERIDRLYEFIENLEKEKGTKA